LYLAGQEIAPMQGDKWTFLVFRGEESVRQYSVSGKAIRYVLGGVASGSVIFTVLLALLGLSGWSQAERALLNRENELLQSQLQDLQSKVVSLEGDVGTLAEKSAQYRVLAGLETIDEDVLQAGVGGPGLGRPEDSPLFDVNEELGEETFALRYDLGALERRARLLSASLAEATDSLEANHDLLERTPSILPAAGFLSSSFSRSRYHPIHHRNLPHEGVDINADRGTPILAAAKGRVVYAGRRSGYGLMVEIDHGNGYVTRYGHASKVLAKRGQEVTRGEVVAQVGNTGIATAPHLHYEVRINGRPVNPLNYVVAGAIP
jgi:murein DD-endopeptidase MepM/ murein hydrolase activator NlpD